MGRSNFLIGFHLFGVEGKPDISILKQNQI